MNQESLHEDGPWLIETAVFPLLMAIVAQHRRIPFLTLLYHHDNWTLLFSGLHPLNLKFFEIMYIIINIIS